MRIADVEVRPLPSGRVQLAIPTDNIPATAELDRGEARMVADELIRLSRTVKL